MQQLVYEIILHWCNILHNVNDADFINLTDALVGSELTAPFLAVGLLVCGVSAAKATTASQVATSCFQDASCFKLPTNARIAFV